MTCPGTGFTSLRSERCDDRSKLSVWAVAPNEIASANDSDKIFDMIGVVVLIDCEYYATEYKDNQFCRNITVLYMDFMIAGFKFSYII